MRFLISPLLLDLLSLKKRELRLQFAETLNCGLKLSRHRFSAFGFLR